MTAVPGVIGGRPERCANAGVSARGVSGSLAAGKGVGTAPAAEGAPALCMAAGACPPVTFLSDEGAEDASGPRLTASLMCSARAMFDRVMINSSSCGTLQGREQCLS